jgi:hypothetical protein
VLLPAQVLAHGTRGTRVRIGRIALSPPILRPP